MDKQELIAALEEIALLLELKGENPFKIRAYQNAARELAGLEEDVAGLLASGALAEHRGFGKALVDKLGELLRTGRLEYLERLRAEFPPGLLELLEIPSLGPKKVRLFYSELHVASLDELAAACADGRVAALPGCGEKTAAKILAGIARRREFAAQFLYPEALRMADEVMAALRRVPGLERLELAGSLRRLKETTKDADLLGSARDPAAVMAAFVALPLVKEVLGHGETKSTVILRNGLQVDLRLVEAPLFPFAWHHFTGSREHNVAMRARALRRGLQISEWGLFDKADGGQLLPCASEAEFFARLGLDYIPPELREDLGEIAAAEAHTLPTLVTLADYRGSLHNHTLASDGLDPLGDLVAHARDLGHSFIGITDHSRSSVQANGLDAKRLLDQVASLRQFQAQLPDFRLFAGVECDILPDGSLDYPDEVLAQLDYVIAAVHSSFTQSRADMTARILRALDNPYVRILAHPSGRLLLRRDAYEVDLDQVLAAAAARGVAIELNCHPRRLDLDWRLWHRARDLGLRCSLNPDAHAVSGFDTLALGIGFCRKGWLRAEDILNCWPRERLEACFAAPRRA